MKTEAIKAKAAEVTIAGVTIKGYQLPDGSYRCNLSNILQAFGIETRDARRYASNGILPSPENLALVTLKVSEVNNGKRSTIPRQMYLLSLEQMNQALLGLFASGFKAAGDVLVATANETWQRRFDEAFGVQKTNADYETQTRDFFRELARKSYHPQLTAAMNGSFSNNRWGKEINRFKLAAGLPVDCVDNYGKHELELWNDAMSRYNCLRAMDYTHEKALQEITRQRIDREVL